MHDELPIALTLDYVAGLADCELDSLVRRAAVFRLDFPLRSLGFSGNPGDIADDYMDASYFGEKLARHCSSIAATTVHGKIESAVRFAMVPLDAAQLVAELRRIAPGFAYDEPDIDIREEMAEFEDNIFEADLKLTQLADSYMANFLAGDRYDENTEYWHARIPSLRSGFWPSFASRSEGTQFYVSQRWNGFWIVLGDRAATERLLAHHGGFGGTASRLFDSASLRLGNHPHVVMTPGAFIEVTSRDFERALLCLRRYIAPKLPAEKNGVKPWARFGRRPEIEWDRWYGFSWAMTEDGDVVVCGDDQVHFVAFYQTDHRLRPESVQKLLADADHVIGVSRRHLGLDVVPQDWRRLTPERFEELCYEVLLRTGKFDERSFRKHGRTKSRDGGRDIEAWTLPRVNEPSEKWIFQCKFIASGSALSGTKLVISDVIEQYDAKGFGIMTNEVIDSTLYDKLDKITGTRRVGRDTWDGARLQRFLAARPDLFNRFFHSA